MFGYSAVPGWDPVTGLGTLSYPGLRRALFPEDYSAPGFAATPGVGSEPSYANRDNMPWIILPLMAIGFITSAVLIGLFGRRIKEVATKQVSR